MGESPSGGDRGGMLQCSGLIQVHVKMTDLSTASTARTMRSMDDFIHERHKPLTRPRAAARAGRRLCAAAQQRQPLAHRAAGQLLGCAKRVIACGTAKVIGKIARDGADTIEIEVHRTLPPVLKELRHQGYQLVGLEQTTRLAESARVSFERHTALVVGNERAGITDDILALLDQRGRDSGVWLPYSYNVATATTMALYEYCRQFPTG